jgi:hypothetical protein
MEELNVQGALFWSGKSSVFNDGFSGATLIEVIKVTDPRGYL